MRASMTPSLLALTVLLLGCSSVIQSVTAGPHGGGGSGSHGPVDKKDKPCNRTHNSTNHTKTPGPTGHNSSKPCNHTHNETDHKAKHHPKDRHRPHGRNLLASIRNLLKISAKPKHNKIVGGTKHKRNDTKPEHNSTKHKHNGTKLEKQHKGPKGHDRRHGNRNLLASFRQLLKGSNGPKHEHNSTKHEHNGTKHKHNSTKPDTKHKHKKAKHEKLHKGPKA